MQLEGRSDIPNLLHLPYNELEFVVAFIRSSGSLKEMARLFGQSYPTVRNRLDEIIAKLDREDGDMDRRRHEILDAVAKGELDAKQGARRLRELET